MKHLILYIDLEYIKAIVKNEGGKFSFIETEDRDSVNCFWLYFLIDQFNKRVRYKKTYILNVHNKKPGYFSYSYPSERDFENETILFDGYNHKWEELLEISGIIGRIKNEFRDIETEIPTYIVYSSNISFRNREVLNYYLLKQGINRISDALSFPELYAFKFKDELKSRNNVIIIESLNNDLNLSYLYFEKNVFIKPANANKLLRNKGNDPRANTLLECVVSELSRQSNFLRIQSNRNIEIKQLKNRVSEWSNRLNSKNILILDDVELTCDPGIKYKIQIKKKEVEDKTGKYIRDLLAEIRQFSNDIKVNTDNLHYVLIGDLFNNKNIIARFTEEFGVNSFSYSSNANIINILSISEEAYECYKSRIDEVEITRRYNEKFELGNVYLINRNFEKAKTAFIEAKNIHETDEVVLKLGEIEEQIKRAKKNEIEFKTLISESDKLVEDKQYKKAIDKIDEALELYPENETAINKRNLVKLKIDRQFQDFNSLYNEALNLFKQDDFVNAQNILIKALEIIPDDKNSLELLEKSKAKQKLIKTYKEAEAEYIKHNFLKAKEIYERGLPDSHCQKMVLQCEKLAIFTDDLSKQLMLIHEIIKEENIKQISGFIMEAQKTLFDIKIFDKSLDFEKYEKELEGYNSKLTSLISKIYISLVKKADELYYSNSFDDAENEYRKILEIKPNDKYSLDQLNKISQKINESILNVKKAQKFIDIANTYFENKDWQKAKNNFGEAQKLIQNDTEIQNKMNECNEKISHAERHIKNATNLINRGKNKLAKKEIQEAIILYPTNKEVIDILHKIENGAKEDESINNNANNGVKTPTDIPQLNGLQNLPMADTLFNCGYFNDALEVYKKLLENGRRISYIKDKINICCELSQHERKIIKIEKELKFLNNSRSEKVIDRLNELHSIQKIYHQNHINDNRIVKIINILNNQSK